MRSDELRKCWRRACEQRRRLPTASASSSAPERMAEGGRRSRAPSPWKRGTTCR